jgi:YYY domain-containing protein
MGNYFLIHGLFLFVAVTHLVVEFRSWSKSWSLESLQKWKGYAAPVLFGFILFPVILLLALLRGYWIAPLALIISGAAGLLAIRPSLPTVRRIPLILISAAIALTVVVEVIVLAGDIGRMNTVFKFYLQVWVLLSIVSGVTIIWDWPAITARPQMRRIWQVGFAILLAVAALYPILATKAKWDIRMSDQAPITLDGMAFMRTTSYTDTAFDGSVRTIHLDQDYEAIKWLQQNIDGSPVIVEAHSSNPYRSIANRVSMYTGLPTIVGWDWHQRQQRAVLPGTFVANRIWEVNTLYNTTDVAEAMEILDRYDVAYIYVGPLEWTYYRPSGLIKFNEMVEAGTLRIVYLNNGVTIYEYPDHAVQTIGYLSTLNPE